MTTFVVGDEAQDYTSPLGFSLFCTCPLSLREKAGLTGLSNENLLYGTTPSPYPSPGGRGDQSQPGCVAGAFSTIVIWCPSSMMICGRPFIDSTRPP